MIVLWLFFAWLLAAASCCPLSITALCKCHVWLSGLYLDCSHANLTEVTEVLREIKTPVSKLKIHHSFIPILRADDLRALFVKQLDLAFNNLTEVEDGALRSQGELLQYLRLANNSLQDLPNLEGLRQLENLDLTGNELSSIPEKAFKDTSLLTQLRLQDNNICFLSRNALNETKGTLELLDLSDNCLTSVPAQNIRGAPRLAFLDLSNNRIVDLPNLQFMNLPMLKEVRLTDNEIRQMARLAFMNVPNLQQLHLGGNRLATLEVNRFEAFERLEFLDLSRNSISRIQSSVFKEMPRLKQLFLDGNRIETIETLGFSSNPNLQLISIQNNQLSRLFRNAFDSLPKLVMLLLANNSLEIVGRGVFSGMRNLQQLVLRNNSIQTIETEAFESIPQLTTLDLGHNLLGDVPVTAFKGLSKLFWLDLSYNGIETFQQGTFTSKITNIILHGNRLRCDDKLDWFVKYLVTNNIRTFLPNQPEITCESPAKYAGVRLKDLMIQQANETFHRAISKIIPEVGGIPGTSGSNLPLGNLIPGLDAIPGLGGQTLPGLTAGIPGFNDLAKVIPSLRQLPGLDAITDINAPYGGILGQNGADLLPVLNDFTTPLAKFATGQQPQPGDVSDLVGSIPRLLSQLPPGPGGIDISKLPPELIRHVLNGGAVPGIPKAVTDRLMRQYLKQMAEAARALKNGMTTTPSGVEASTLLPPLSSLPPDLVHRVMQGGSLPGLTTREMTDIKHHYVKEVLSTQKVEVPGATEASAEKPLLITGVPPDELVQELLQELDLSQLPPELLQKIVVGEPLEISQIPQEILAGLKARNPSLYQQLQSSFGLSGTLPATVVDRPSAALSPVNYGSDVEPYDLDVLDRGSDVINAKQVDKSNLGLYTGIGLATVGLVTIVTIGYLCYKRKQTRAARDDLDRSKFFRSSPQPSTTNFVQAYADNNRNFNWYSGAD